MRTSVSIRRVQYAESGDELRRIRFSVFVEEQGVPKELEIDAADAEARHVLACVNDVAVGTGRILDDGHIGRVAVLADWRGKGIGTRIMKELIQIALERGRGEVWLSSQVSAVGFYRSLGFAERGGAYVEAGIDHIDMAKRIG